MHCREATGDGAKENYGVRDHSSGQNLFPSFLAELLRFENSRNVEIRLTNSAFLGAIEAVAFLPKKQIFRRHALKARPSIRE
jgi:hypothetical protein